MGRRSRRPALHRRHVWGNAAGSGLPGRLREPRSHKRSEKQGCPALFLRRAAPAPHNMRPNGQYRFA
jgi:hypothetical protein